MITLNNVLQETGLSYYTLFKYTSLGILPKPQRNWTARKGSQSLYPDDVIDILNRIKEDQLAGLTLRQIAENRAIERAMDAFAGIMKNLPNYHFTNGKITQIDERSDGSVVVNIEMVGVKRG